MVGAETEKARLSKFSLVLGIENSIEIDDLSCIGNFDRCMRLARHVHRRLTTSERQNT